MFYILFNVEIYNCQISAFGGKRWFTNFMVFFFLSGLRHITILKLLGVGEEVGGVLELFPINGKVLLF